MTTPHLPLSAAIIARDASRTLEAALRSLAFCDEIVVLDSGSTDGTPELARAAGARVEFREWTGFRDQKNAAAALCRHDWVLSIDADEEVTPALAHEIAALFSDGEPAPAGFSMPRSTRYLGREIRGAGWYPDRAIRLYDRRRGRWVGGRVHERVALDGAAGSLSADLLHAPYASLEHHIEKMNHYTTLAAETMHARGKRANWTHFALRPPLVFFKSWVLRRGFTLGAPGFVVSASSALAVFLKYVKLRELHRRGVAPDPAAAADHSDPATVAPHPPTGDQATTSPRKPSSSA